MTWLAWAALALGLLLSGYNWASFYHGLKGRHVSPTPLLGALFLFVGLAHFQATRPWAWLAIPADYGTLVLIFSIPSLFGQFWSTSSVNLVRALLAAAPGKTLYLRLYKEGVFTLEAVFDPPAPCNEQGALIGNFGFQGRWRQEGEVLVLTQYDERRELRLALKDGRGLARETGYAGNSRFPYDALDGVEFRPS